MLPSRYAMPQRYTRPDRAAMQALQDAYHAAKAAGYTSKRRPWPEPVLVALGRLYVQAWGTVPTQARLQARWCMPEAKAIVHTFGSYTAYYARIQEDTP